MKITKSVFLIAVCSSPAVLADQVGHGDPINCAYSCASGNASSDTDASDASLLDALLDLFTLDEEAEDSE